ncbi:hypothetical protein NHG29_01625 [Aerococcaceae bacterium NML160702]|nr:hypothetical protein [Aerococcaceae bacterium NML160702]
MEKHINKQSREMRKTSSELLREHLELLHKKTKDADISTEDLVKLSAEIRKTYIALATIYDYVPLTIEHSDNGKTMTLVKADH